ncbi:hypothetical protein IAQ61_003202 [Plenodomus lingam]|uniref:WKF domain-containing protein n=1 Tax=Leptosphaeria maculans (strain JN3 / isolate v23.1.3 / race Av1-4-5-6-7-8) TaxID=985895 RepID=E5ADT2_LEPMJ|nr:hypothetical protein LEMA_P001580.1 [Plenodomus lingam JN3]KAH9875738.1 hypothetical protein IAQ61_003202 [Plenodomus lingam]CBY01371.1 hypothetical protein LEMA_P001580.1 [Plenodomus lingam JN3]
MSLDGQRVPAWRRLGLSLKHQDPSGVAVPEAQPLHNNPEPVPVFDAPVEPGNNYTSPLDAPVNGKSLTLGKRKHQPEPAEDAGQISKRNKTDIPEVEKIGTAVQEIPVVSETAHVTTDALIEKPTSGAARPKGDPNYRKKKEKVTKRRKENAKPKPAVPSPSETANAVTQPTLLASTETDHVAPSSTQKPSKKDTSRKKSDSASPSQIDRRKSVAFTPDTKTSDGNSGQELFKKWVAEQKGTGDVSAPPAVSNFTLHSLIAEEEKAARKNGQLDKKVAVEDTSVTASDPAENTSIPANHTSSTSRVASASTPSPNTTKGKKKDPAVYISYLTQYYSDRDNWKFNKAKQNDVVDNALSIFRIPHEHTEALSEYLTGLKGAGVIERLRERCLSTLKELDEQDAQKPMDDIQARKVAEQEAEHERIIQQRKRRRTEADVEKFMHHPHGDGYIRRLQRKRAEALLAALGRAAPILPAVNQHSSINPMMKSVAPLQRDARKRKRRTEVSSDESSSDSSSDESSDSDSDSESDSEESNSGESTNSDASSSSSSDNGSSSDSSSDSESD